MDGRATRSNPARERLPFVKNTTGGVLVVVEGVSRAGKSTLVRELVASCPRPVKTVLWNSHHELSPVTRSLMQRRELTSFSLTLLQVADLRLTYESEALPALWRGEVVIYDRYFYSAWVRGRIRGVPASLLYELSHQFIRPDLTLFLDTDPRITVDRFIRTRHGGGYFGVGRDIFDKIANNFDRNNERYSEDAHELASFKWWNSEQVEAYRSMAKIEGFVSVDHTAAFINSIL